ncbi:uncharacterized protein Eint_050850 [Encephalitozoon intestinalis ATCC 50506]|uniref:Uncharacterized protein n=1 Tax=Encephalitozoon intestinalis (strain ATCC 50506) TaxID=876142 RepID=E0S7A5_ENCIT|nr:uncharacterized protein Eint_050850 [Encephalitozoon intestinalis ATCC 50506]ADM11533.1 hypothetical protein Eint_050850 [Encephalitozoon intestinalis ATCC 50506]UTX45247.1 hypothetical protein GPK93_05g07920 [Encephalitozoon intestinalis]
MFEYYEEPVLTNDLLSLAYILDGNVGKIVFTSEMDPKVFPRDPIVPSKYAEALSSFESFLDFYRNLKEEGDYSEIITYYKLKHRKLSFIALHLKYVHLKKGAEKIDQGEDAGYYNEDLYKTLLECNQYVSRRESKDMFLAPLYMSRFYKENGELVKSRRLKKEAQKMAGASRKLDVVWEADDKTYRSFP